MTTRLNRITQQRREKLERLREQGIEPYPHRYQRSHTTQEAVYLLEQNEAGQTEEKQVSVAGRIMAIRRMGKGAFADIRDGSGKIQLLFQDMDKFPSEQSQLFKELDIGDFIGVEGQVLRTRTGEPTVGVKLFTA
ncbi:MAG: hypothetical protein H8E40_00335 [Chloroflexi bacterium]|nr:hypothetical protein [Chloroflexota bacterium]